MRTRKDQTDSSSLPLGRSEPHCGQAGSRGLDCQREADSPTRTSRERILSSEPSVSSVFRVPTGPVLRRGFGIACDTTPRGSPPAQSPRLEAAGESLVGKP